VPKKKVDTSNKQIPDFMTVKDSQYVIHIHFRNLA
jgi:hypothetical protein